MTLPERIRFLTGEFVADRILVETLIEALDEVQAMPPEELRDLGADLHAAVSEATKAVGRALEEVREALAARVQARRGLQGFGHLHANRVGQRVDRRA